MLYVYLIVEVRTRFNKPVWFAGLRMTVQTGQLMRSNHFTDKVLAGCEGREEIKEKVE